MNKIILTNGAINEKETLFSRDALGRGLKQYSGEGLNFSEIEK